MTAAASTEARRLKAAGRIDEALAFNLQALAQDPSSAVAEHNLASTLGDLSRFSEAEQAARRALAKGLNAAETHLVLARALQGQLRLDEAEAVFEQALELRPAYLDAHRDLAQLRWMRSSDIDAACARIDALLANPAAASESGRGAFVILRAKIEQAAGHVQEAAQRLAKAVQRAPQDASLQLAAAQAYGAIGQSDTQMEHAAAALRLVPGSAEAARIAVEALLGLGKIRDAEVLAARIMEHHPQDQGVRALLVTAWRMLGDPRAAVGEDAALIQSHPIATPRGWSDQAAYLNDLAEALRARHAWHAHPIEQSLRQGSQTQENLSRSNDPAIAALFRAVAAPIAKYMESLGPGKDDTRERLRIAAARLGRPVVPRIVGAWSVLLRPGGYHVDHVHPQGWLSSAFHVEMPNALNDGHQGWLAFGRPGIATLPKLEPLRRVRPVPGNLVLFPSWMWHGTEAFTGSQSRLTVAFDIVPS